ncbi:NUDIX hydrolase domain-like protein [Phialemonium atrogriseum]|uniref:NUDIX hydrolase domain-like protein n=1 Tax=Phialemonium atrogriseum TaxID=1093897 RepID=A0AAJ0FMX1_9PEZI|nr:NUDIX hydrolase domain-like protein [Phialemonium atrogriseum]KAK1768703.1 NUDIX hydrolase domain-like protein [Phialemonium atrogriseum]
MDLDLEEIDRSMTFHPSEACVVSCGTVTIDPAACKVLLIWNRHLNIYQLPKGRKNIGEDMLSAALRETYEETGVHATPLRLKIATRATPPSDKDEDEGGNGGDVGLRPTREVTEGRLSTEFIGCCRYPDPQSSTPADKVVFYYAAIADSAVPRGAGTPRDRKKLKEVWAPAAEAATLLRFRAEADIVRKALEDARRSGYQMAG